MGCGAGNRGPWDVCCPPPSGRRGSPVSTQREYTFQVQAVPTLLLLDQGEAIARQAGAAPANVLRQWVEETIAGRR